jgi:hypothetical protein
VPASCESGLDRVVRAAACLLLPVGGESRAYAFCWGLVQGGEVAFCRGAVSIVARKMDFEIVSREQELASLHAFIGDAETGGPAALVLEGEAGIGKSTLWLAGVEHARAQGFRVLSSRPAEAERALAHAGLGDLFDDLLDDVLATLSGPRRRALEVALLLEGTPDPVDPRALGVAVRDALQLLTERESTLIAVDDVQWLDSSTSDALAFALRRLGESPIQLLLARRQVNGSQPPTFEQVLEAEQVERLPVGPLSVGAVHRFLRDRLDRSFARQTLLRIHERSGGNPFFALELARIVGEHVDPLEPFPVPETLEELVRARISGFPASTREALALASALGTTPESLLERVGIGSNARPRDDPLHPSALVIGLLPAPGRGEAKHSHADCGSRRRPAPSSPSPRPVERHAGRRRRRCPRSCREARNGARRVGRRG